MGALAALCPQVLAGAAGVHGQEGGQDLRHGRRQGVAGAGPPAARRLARAARAQRQLARARAPQGREDVPPLQERRAAHQVDHHRRRLVYTHVLYHTSTSVTLWSTELHFRKCMKNLM